MSKQIDVQQVKDDADMVDVIGRYVKLKQEGEHWKGCCPFHEEDTASFVVTPSKQLFKCFGCGEHGDVIDFVKKISNKSFKEAVQEIADPYNTQAIPYHGLEKKPAVQSKPKKPAWKHVVPGDKSVLNTKHYKHGDPSMIWEYTNGEGQVVGYVCRFDTKDGKEVLPLIYATNGSAKKWVFKGFEKPRPLYNLHKLHKVPTKSVLVVEGEKAADAAIKLFPHLNVTCWIGGGAGVKYTNWSDLKDRVVILWPDHDNPGYKCMHQVYEHVKDIALEVKWVNPPVEATKGWDIADSNWTEEEAKKHTSENIIPYPGPKHSYGKAEEKLAEKEEAQAQKAVEGALEVINEQDKIAAAKALLREKEFIPWDLDPEDWPIIGKKHFKMLGARKEGNGMVYYFYSYHAKPVIGLSPAGMTKNNLLQLAPLSWWQNSFMDKKYQFDVAAASSYLVMKSSEFGIYSDRNLRGRGAWMDRHFTVVHAGNRLIVNGKGTELSDFQSKYIYEAGEELGFNVKDPLKNVHSKKMIDLLQLLNWERPINAYLLAGWCVLAPVCGALSWRPHIWLTGAAGTGKSWVFKNIVRELLGETALAVQGETSEAGLRQTLGHDALPVVFDEAEGEDRRAQDRMHSVLALMRASSVNDGGLMAKGSAGGAAKTYRIRSCFAFASIGVQVAQQSDRTRVSVLGLVKSHGERGAKRWASFQNKYNSMVTPDYCKRLRARTISILPTILSNIKTFSNAAAAVIGEQRSGDQIGVLLAGAFSLTSDKKISYDEAVDWVEKRDWSEEKGLNSTRDELALLEHILEQTLRIETDTATVERTVGELILIALTLRTAWNIAPKHANDRLKRVGIKVIDERIYVSNTDAHIKNMLRDTPWAKNHNKILMRIKGAEASENTVRFASGIKTRAVMMTKDVMFPNFEPEADDDETKPLKPIESVQDQLDDASDENLNEELPF